MGNENSKGGRRGDRNKNKQGAEKTGEDAYKLGDVIGSGGFANVVKATRIYDGKTVAIKKSMHVLTDLPMKS